MHSFEHLGLVWPHESKQIETPRWTGRHFRGNVPNDGEVTVETNIGSPVP